MQSKMQNEHSKVFPATSLPFLTLKNYCNRLGKTYSSSVKAKPRRIFDLCWEGEAGGNKY